MECQIHLEMNGYSNMVVRSNDRAFFLGYSNWMGSFYCPGSDPLPCIASERSCRIPAYAELPR